MPYSPPRPGIEAPARRPLDPSCSPQADKERSDCLRPAACRKRHKRPLSAEAPSVCLSAPLEPSCSPQADKEQSDCLRPLGAPTSAKTSPASGGRGLCDSERSGEHPSGAEKTNKAALKTPTSESPSSPSRIAREDSPLSESAQSPRPTATPIPSSATTNPRRPTGVLGSTPLDLPPRTTSTALRHALHAAGFHHLRLYGLDSGLTHYTRAAENRLNLVIAPSGLPAARWLQKTFGTPFEITWPLAPHQLAAALETLPAPAHPTIAPKTDLPGIPPCLAARLPRAKNILILHQQIAANALRTLLHKALPQARITCATFFTFIGALAQPQDQKLREETDLPTLAAKEHYDLILADPLIKRLLPDTPIPFLPLPHPAVSGF